ncbi:MAG: hypothetical protein ACYDEE_14215 [Ignavibacteriaceae bacterium]
MYRTLNWDNGILEYWGIILKFFYLLWLIDSFFLGIKTVETVNKLRFYVFGTHDLKSWAAFVEQNKSDGFTGYIQLRGT